MGEKGILIAATGQNVGKTTLCLGLVAGLRNRFGKAGFMKPVGQRYVHMTDQLDVDKDVLLFKNFFSIQSEYKEMSPVILPQGFTREYLNGCHDPVLLHQKIIDSYKAISSSHPYTIVEGTGHIGVGSIVGLNNAKIASILGLDVVIVALGGLGSSFDELTLNINLCAHYGVKVRGIILNRVLEAKREMVLEYFPKALKSMGIPVIGCMPYIRFLSRPTLQDFEALFGTALISGHKHRCRHFSQNRLVAGSLESYLEEIVPNELIITPACRDDIILATLRKHLQSLEETREDFRGGMILTGSNPPSHEILEQIKQNDLPVLYAPRCSYDVMKMLTSFVAKIHIEDVEKIKRAIQVVEQYIDFDALCMRETVQI